MVTCHFGRHFVLGASKGSGWLRIVPQLVEWPHMDSAAPQTSAPLLLLLLLGPNNQLTQEA